jgi:plasmid stabilization system protein ParE
MKNICQIEWTFEAKQNLDGIFDYLEIVWTEREISNFAQLLEENLQRIANNPSMFPYYDEKINVRRCVISPQTTIYYREIKSENKVIIITLFDNRQNPDHLTRIFRHNI